MIIWNTPNGLQQASSNQRNHAFTKLEAPFNVCLRRPHMEGLSLHTLLVCPLTTNPVDLSIHWIEFQIIFSNYGLNEIYWEKSHYLREHLLILYTLLLGIYFTIRQDLHLTAAPFALHLIFETHFLSIDLWLNGRSSNS